MLTAIHQELISRVGDGLEQRSNAINQIKVRLDELVVLLREVLWPRTAIYKERDALDGRWFQQPEEGMLGFFGYHVGRSQGLERAERQAILDYVYAGKLPLINTDSYMSRWGEPASSQRLREMVDSLDRFSRQARGRTEHDLEDALQEWADDRGYLWRRYYVKNRACHVWSWRPID